MHTGYIPPKVLRLRKSEIDGACNDARYPDNFYIDLVFEECSVDLNIASNLTSTSDNKMDGSVSNDKNADISIANTTVAYDSMLHRDSRFWEVISKRRNEKNQSATISSYKMNQNAKPFYGPLIGRRREFEEEKTSLASNNLNPSVPSIGSSIQSFTIGEELDFTTHNNMLHAIEMVKDPSDIEKEKDELMEALMALENDEYVDDEKITHTNDQSVTEKNDIDVIDKIDDIDSMNLSGEAFLSKNRSQEDLDGQDFLGGDGSDESDLGDPELKDLEDFLMKVKI